MFWLYISSIQKIDLRPKYCGSCSPIFPDVLDAVPSKKIFSLIFLLSMFHFWTLHHLSLITLLCMTIFNVWTSARIWSLLLAHPFSNISCYPHQTAILCCFFLKFLYLSTLLLEHFCKPCVSNSCTTSFVVSFRLTCDKVSANVFFLLWCKHKWIIDLP